MFKTKQKGFTLIELLIVIAIVGILAAAVFVALDPLTRFQDSRDARRWSDTANILSAIKVDQVDNKGAYLTAIEDADIGTVYMISDGGVTGVACTTDCDSTECLDLSGLRTEGYLGVLPVSPKSTGEWAANITGYTLTKISTSTITIAACEAENVTSGISVTR